MAKTASKKIDIVVALDQKPLSTPEKKPLVAPTQGLADALAAEWQGKKFYNAAAMPLTSLAYTAIDRVSVNRADIIEVMIAYVDTDALCYRASGSKVLHERQKQEWDPLLAWAGNKFSALWQTATGVMPVAQSAELHDAIREDMERLSDMELAAVSLLASLLSSLVLALAVYEKRLSEDEAFRLSRLEETFQMEGWGEDTEAKRRADIILKEIKDVTRFLRLLEQP
jgi:chaperone required for assembly of F1-ATPase